MPIRNGDHGYGGVTKLFHWLTVSLVLAQFLVGYTMATDDSAADHVHDAKEHCRATEDSDAAEAEEERCEEELDRREDELDDAEDSPSRLHVLLGLAILLMGVVRVGWRRVGGLPPWAEALGETERFLEAWLEKILLGLLFVIPITGLLLLAGEDDWMFLHVASHITFFTAVGLHIGLVLKHTVIQRDRHLERML